MKPDYQDLIDAINEQDLDKIREIIFVYDIIKKDGIIFGKGHLNVNWLIFDTIKHINNDNISIEIISMLLDGGLIPDAKTIFECKKSKILLTFLEHGVNPNICYERTYLLHHFAKSYEPIEILLKFGANPNVLDKDGKNPLWYCMGFLSAKLLIDAGADVNNVSNLGEKYYKTLLHDTLSHEIEILKYIIENDAYIKINMNTIQKIKKGNSVDIQMKLLDVLFTHKLKIEMAKLKEKNRKLEKENEELKIKVDFAPFGVGYELAKKDFEEKIEEISA